MSMVIDASISIAWLLREETLRGRDEFAARLRSHGAITPSHWWLEIANALMQSVRRRRLTAADVESYLVALGAVPVATDGETGDHAWGDTLTIAQRHNLTVYDAAYLELAIRRQLPLAALDDRLVRAARIEDVAIAFGPPNP